MSTLKRIASTSCDWKESFDRDDHNQLYDVVNDPESESMELGVWTADSKLLARGPKSFFENLPKDIGDWLHDNDNENIYWDEKLKEVRVFWKGIFITQEAWEVIVQDHYGDDKEDELIKDTDNNKIPTEEDIANYSK